MPGGYDRSPTFAPAARARRRRAADDVVRRRRRAADRACVTCASAYDLDEAALLAIPDYDSLAASQVVPRLAGLTPTSSRRCAAYEAAHRARRTILGRVAQLQQSA